GSVCGELFAGRAGEGGGALPLPPWAYGVPIAIAAGGVLLGLVSVLCHRAGPGTRDFTCAWSVRLLLLAVAAAALLDALPLLLGLVPTVPPPAHPPPNLPLP